MYMMEISLTFLLTGCLIQGVFCVFKINLPEKVVALQGSCVFIPCTFDIAQKYEADLTDSAKRMWYKDGDPPTPVFESSSPDSEPLRGEIFGTPRERNCSTRFDNVSQSHNGSYFFRLETTSLLKYTYIKPTYSQVEIAVIDPPPKPTVSLLMDQQEVTEVTEGSSVNLRCSTKIFCPFSPAVLTWSSSPEHLLNESITQQQRQEQTELISDLIFTVTHRHHLATFNCTVTHQQIITERRSRTLTLRVQYAPRNTSVHVSPSGFVVAGGSVTLSCSSDANPPVLNYTWYRDTEEPLKPVQTGQNLTISNTDPTHRGRYVCTAQNEHGTQNASVLLDVQFAPKISSSCNQSSGIICVCEAHGNPLPKLEWRLSGNVLANSTNTSIWNETLGNLQLKSVLIIRQPLTDMTLLLCFSANTHGTASQKFHPIASPQETKTETSFHHPSVLLGAAVGASAMIILYIMGVCYQRRRNPKPSGTRQDDTSGLILAQTATASDGDDEFVYSNKDTLSAVPLRSPESLHYSSIDFTNAEPASGEIRGASSLTDEYAVVRCCPASAKDPNQDQSPQDDSTDVYAVVHHSSASAKDPNQDQSPKEDMIYENMTRHLVV